MKKFTKRIVSLITAISLSISSTVMILPANAFAEDQTEDQIAYGNACAVEECDGTYDWFSDYKGTHYLRCDLNSEHTTNVTHIAGTDDTCSCCADMPTATLVHNSEDGGTFTAVSDGKTLSEDDYTSLDIGSVITLTAIPDKGYRFVSWDIFDRDDIDSTNSSTTEITMTEESITISAEFEKINYNISGSLTNGYFVATIDDTLPDVESNDTITTANYEDTVTINLKGYYNYSYVQDTLKVTYSEDGIETEAELTTVSPTKYYFTMPAADVTVSAEFVYSPIKYNVSAEIQDSHGTISPYTESGFENIIAGEEVRFTVEPAYGYSFDPDESSIYYEGITAYDDPVKINTHTDSDGNIDYYYFTMPRGNTTICAVFNENNNVIFDITEEYKSNARVIPYGNSSFNNVPSGTKVSFTIDIDKGYEIENIDCDYVLETEQLTDGTTVYSFTIEDDSVYIGLWLKRVSYNVTVSASNATVTPYEGTSFDYITPGTEVKFKVIADLNYSCSVSVVYIEDETVEKDLEFKNGYYCFTMPDSDLKIIVTSKRAIDWSKNGDGSYTINATNGSDEESYRTIVIPVSEFIDEGKSYEEISSVSGKLVSNGKFDISFQIGNYIESMDLNDGEPTKFTLELPEDNDPLSDNSCLFISINSAKKGSELTVKDINVSYKKYSIVNYTEELSFSCESAEKGDVVTFSINPEKGYKLDELTITYEKDGEDAPIPVTITDNSFIMPAADVYAYATFKETVFYVTAGEINTSVDTMAEVSSFVDENCINKDVTIKLKDQYNFSSTDKLPEKAKSIVFEGDSIIFDSNFSVLDIPVDTTFNLNMRTENQNRINVNIAAGKTLTLGEMYTGDIFDELKGNETSSLILADNIGENLTFGKLSSFDSVKINNNFIYVYGNISSINSFEGEFEFSGHLAIESFKGTLKLTSDSVASINKISASSTITLNTNSDSILPELTISDINGMLYLIVDDGTTAIKSGQTLLYTKGKDLSKQISIKNEDSNYNQYTAVYYSKTKEIKAEALVIRLYTENGDNEIGVYSNFDALFNAISKLSTAYDFVIELGEEVTVPESFAFPKKNVKSILIQGSAITFTGTKINIPYDVDIYSEIKVENANNSIDFTVAGGKKLSVFESKLNSNGKPYINKITGTTTSIFCADDATVYVNDISNFKKVTASYNVNVYGNISNVGEFNGVISICGKQSTADIKKLLDGANVKLYMSKNGNIPKLTITEAEDSVIEILDENGKTATLPSGTIIAYTKGKDITDHLSVFNSNENDVQLTTYYYKNLKAIKAEDGSAITLRASGVYKGFPNFELLSEYFNSHKDKLDYSVTLNQDITVYEKFALPSKNNAKSIVFEGNGTLTFTGTKLAIPYDVTFRVPIKASNKNNLIDFTVSGNATLKISKSTGELNEETKSYTTYINKISGTKSSKLVLGNDTIVNNIATFGEVTGNVYIAGTATGITGFNGNMFLIGEKSSAVIDKVWEASRFTLVKNSNGVIPKLTVTSFIADEAIAENYESGNTFSISVYNSLFEDFEYEYPIIESGSIIAYTKGNDLKENIKVLNVVEDGFNLSPTYDSKQKAIKAEYNNALILSRITWEGETDIYTVDSSFGTNGYKNFINFDELFGYINNQTFNKGDTLPCYLIEVNTDLTLDSKFSLPKATQTSGLYFWGEHSLTFTGTKLAIPYNTLFKTGIDVNNKTKLLDISVEKNAKLIIAEPVYDTGIDAYHFGKVTGKTGSELIAEADWVDFTSISGFDSVRGQIKTSGNMSKIGEFSGILDVYGAKTAIDITKITRTEYTKVTYLYLNETSDYILPKVTIADIDDNANLEIKVCKEDDIANKEPINLESGRTLLYVKNANFNKLDKIAVENNGDLKVKLDAKTKGIKTVGDKIISLSVFKTVEEELECIYEDKYATFEEAVDYINTANKPDQTYQIAVNESIEPAKFSLPNAGKAKKLIIQCMNDSAINIGKNPSINANCPIELDNVIFKSTAKTLTLNAKDNVLLRQETTIDSFKGKKSAVMTVIGNTNKSYDVTGFGTLSVGEEYEDGYVRVKSSLNVDTLVIENGSELHISDTLKSGSFKSFKSFKDAKIVFDSIGKSTLKFSGKNEDFVVDNDGLFISGNAVYGTKILSTKNLTDLNKKFKLYEYDYDSSNESIKPFFAQVNSDIVLLEEVFELSSDKKTSTEGFAQWSDIVNTISKAKDGNANYTIKLLKSIDLNSTPKFPTKGTYASLTIEGSDAENLYSLSFKGSLNLTGNTTFRNIDFYSMGKTTSSDFNLNGTGYNVIFENSTTNRATIKSKNLTLENSFITTGKITITDTLATYDSSKIHSKLGLSTSKWIVDGVVNFNLYSGSKLNVSNEITSADPENKIYLNVIDKKTENELTSFTKNYSLGKVTKGSKYLYLTADDYKINADAKGNLTIVTQ